MSMSLKPVTLILCGNDFTDVIRTLRWGIVLGYLSVGGC